VAPWYSVVFSAVAKGLLTRAQVSQCTTVHWAVAGLVEPSDADPEVPPLPQPAGVEAARIDVRTVGMLRRITRTPLFA
jgi:hypothetical protein